MKTKKEPFSRLLPHVFALVPIYVGIQNDRMLATYIVYYEG